MPFHRDSEEHVIPNHSQAIKVMRYSRRREGWKHIPRHPKTHSPSSLPTSFRLVTWNVEAFWPHAADRILCALRHLEEEQLEVIESENDEELPEHSVICLQEVSIEAFQALRRDTWVQENFYITPSSEAKWPEGAGYGNVTLIQSDMVVHHASIIHYMTSTMQRTALVVDLCLGFPRTNPTLEKTVRVVNTHLESPVPDGLDEQFIANQSRLTQLKVCSHLAFDRDIDLGAVVVGDMNCVTEEDKEAPGQLMLTDLVAPTESRRMDVDDPENKEFHTWGFQTPNNKYPSIRFDKILYSDKKLLNVVYPPEFVGVGVRLEGVPTEGGEDMFVSDHYGLTTIVSSQSTRRERRPAK